MKEEVIWSHEKTTASAALQSLLTAIQIVNNKLEHLFSLSALRLIYRTDVEVENEGHFKIKTITSVNLQPLAPAWAELCLESARGPSEEDSASFSYSMRTELFEIDSQWHGKCPFLIVFCLVHLTRMETGVGP